MKYPSVTQRNIAHQLCDAGVKILVGTHPHVIQPMEYYCDSLIFYSLGNFIFDSWDFCSRVGAWVRLDFLSPQKVDANYFIINSKTYVPELMVEGVMKNEMDQHFFSPIFLQDESYVRLVNRARMIYRLSTLKHVLLNINRFKHLTRFLSIALKRVVWLFQHRGIEKMDPYQVYRGRLK